LKPSTRLTFRARRAFVVHLRAEPGVDGIRALRALLKMALRRFGLRAVDVRECAPHAYNDDDERALAPTREDPMSAFSDRIRGNQKGFYKVAEFEGGKELTLTISHLDADMEMFGKTVDILNFVETGRQLQINQTNAEILLDAFGDDPENWRGQRITLFATTYEYGDKKGLTIRIKKADDARKSTAAAGDGTAPTRSRPPDDMDDSIPF
jgi:hypothetical protein